MLSKVLLKIVSRSREKLEFRGKKRERYQGILVQKKILVNKKFKYFHSDYKIFYKQIQLSSQP